MDVRRITTIRGPLDALVQATPSKSVTHRALVAAALAEGESTLRRPLDASDTRATRDGLNALGLSVRVVGEDWVVQGGAGRVRGGGKLALGESGTTLRFLTAVAALGQAPSRLDGAPRLRERPLAELIGGLARLGAAVRADPSSGGLPLVAGGAPVPGGSLGLAGARSSQFASALLLIGPHLGRGIDLAVEPPAVSLPYVALTEQVLAAFGAKIERQSEFSWRVAPGGYPGRVYAIEGDHSSASYFLAAAALVGGRVRVRGLSPTSAQPDARLATILGDLGCRVETGSDWVEVEGHGELEPFTLDLSDAPDLAPTMAVLALIAKGPCVLQSIAHLRHKESDRLEVLARNLRMLGRHADALADRLIVSGPPPCLGGGRVATAGDHRIAMAFAVLGLRLSGIEIEEPAVVGKSNPAFWEQLGALERGSVTGSG